MTTKTTKDGRTIKKGKSYTALRMELFVRSQGICECGCGQSAPWPRDGGAPQYWEGALHHVNGRGMGGGKRHDSTETAVWWREECHRAHHNPKVVPRKS